MLFIFVNGVSKLFRVFFFVCLIVDQQYHQLAANFLHTGRGRPPSLPSIKCINNKLLLQFHLLRIEGGKTWHEVEVFTSKLLKNAPPLKSHIETAVRQVQRLERDEVSSFFEEIKNFDYFGPFSASAGLKIEDVLSGQFPVGPVSLTNGLAAELHNLASQQNLRQTTLIAWLQALSTNLPPPDKLKRQLKSTVDRIRNLRKNSTPQGGIKLDSFLHSAFPPSTSNPPPTISSNLPPPNSKSQATQTPCSLRSKDLSAPYIKLLQNEVSILESDLRRNRAELDRKEDTIKLEREVGAVFKAVCLQKESEISRLQSALNKATKVAEKVPVLQAELATAKERHRDQVRETQTLKQTAVYARLKRREKEIRNLRCQLENYSKMLKTQQKKSNKKKHHVHKLQKEVSLLKQRRTSAREKTRQLKEELSNSIPADAIEKEVNAPVATKEGNKFTNSTVICTAQLIGECDISARNCAKVIQTVAQNIFNSPIAENQLPRKSSAQRCANVGGVIAQMHVREEMLTKKFDLHVDGTSRGKNKYVGQQVTLEDRQCLSLGFHSVAREDAKTLLELAVTTLEELSSLGEEDPDTMKTLFRNLVGIMTDRAATMKLFQEEVEKKRQEILESEEVVHRIFCNAHFLLGLSSKATAALEEVEKLQGWTKQLGRDLLPAYRRFTAGEPAAVRLIRLVCDVLGPRGDEKNGCAADWEAYLHEQQATSQLTSFRSNRFNNLFAASAAVIYHLAHILDFFANWKEPSNLKQRSIVADIQSREIILMVGTLAMTYIFVTGPFWKLVCSSIHYLDQATHIQHMQNNIQAAIQSDDLLNFSPSAIPAFPLPASPVLTEVQTYISGLSDEQKAVFCQIIVALLEGFEVVIQRQLADFLPGGIYANSQTDEAARDDMAHCQLNNLLGEACLGDLDFSLFKRRNASVHHHTVINMMKRNKPISNFLLKKTQQEQDRIVTFARQKAQQMRDEARRKEKAVVVERRVFLQQQREKWEQQAARKEERKQEVIRKIQDCGLCVSRADVDELVKGATNKMAALLTQLQFHRTVLGSKDKLLVSTKLRADEVRENLCQYLELNAGNINGVPFVQRAPAADQSAPRPKRRRLRSPSSSNSDSSKEEEEEDSSEESSEAATSNLLRCWEEQSGVFRQGQTLAVYYDQEWYIGEVLSFDEEKADMVFLDRVPGRNLFRWAHKDVDTVHKKFVLLWDVNISSTSGRVWSVREFNQIEEAFKLYKKTYC